MKKLKILKDFGNFQKIDVQSRYSDESLEIMNRKDELEIIEDLIKDHYIDLNFKQSEEW